jgi:hypothetical protein
MRSRKLCSQVFYQEDTSGNYLDGAIRLGRAFLDHATIPLDDIVPTGAKVRGFVLLYFWTRNGFKLCARINEDWQSDSAEYPRPPTAWSEADSFQDLLTEELTETGMQEEEEEEEGDDDEEFELALFSTTWDGSVEYDFQYGLEDQLN